MVVITPLRSNVSLWLFAAALVTSIPLAAIAGFRKISCFFWAVSKMFAVLQKTSSDLMWTTIPWEGVPLSWEAWKRGSISA